MRPRAKTFRAATFRAAKAWNFDRPITLHPPVTAAAGGPPYFAPRGPVRHPLGCRLCDPAGAGPPGWLPAPTPDCKCQRAAFAWVEGKDFVMVAAPPGWGKSYFTLRDIMRRAAANPDLKFPILIPKLAIGRGFSGGLCCDLDEFQGGVMAKLDPAHDLCGDPADEGDGDMPTKVGRIRAWLNDPASSSLAGRMMLVSHAAWAKALGDPGAPQPGVMRNVHAYYDEGHHLAQPWYDGDDDSTDLGDVEREALDAGCAGVTILTATPGRRDRRSLNHADHENKFETFFCPLDLYMRDILRKLRGVSYGSVVLGDWRGGKGEVTRLLKTIAAAKKAGRLRPAIVFTAPCDRPAYRAVPPRWVAGEARRLGLSVKLFVGDRERAVREWAAMSGDEMRAVDVVVTCKVFDEGVDFPYAELAIDLDPPKFVGRIVQRLGRLLRDEKDKCEYVNIWGPVTTGDPQTLELITDRENAALATMLCIDAQVTSPVGPRESPDPAATALRDPVTLAEFNEAAVRLLRSGTDPEFILQALTGWLSAKSGIQEEDCLTAVVAGLARIAGAVHGTGEGAARNPPHPMLATGHSLDLEALREYGVAIITVAKGMFATEHPMTAARMTELREAVERQFAGWDLAELRLAAEAFIRETGKPPTEESGTLYLPDGKTWGAASAWLKAHGPGSLPAWLVAEGLRVILEPFSLEMLRAAAEAVIRETGRHPTAKSRTLLNGRRWSSADRWLKANGHGSLFQWLVKEGLAEAKKPFSVVMLRAAAEAFIRETGRPPTEESGTLHLPDGKTWGAANAWLKAHGPGSSLPAWLVAEGLKKGHLRLAVKQTVEI